MLTHKLNLRHLAAMSAVRAAGSISAAARDVCLTQPAVTQAVAKLERQFGEPLFERGHDGMTPTEAGVILAERVDVALRLIGSRRATMAQIRAFLAVCTHGSYAEAAKSTGLAEASLHRAVGDLSIALATKLCSRRGRGLAISRRGYDIARALRLAMIEIDAARIEIAALAGREIGAIRIGAMPLARARILPDAVTAFHKLCPGTTIAIVEGSYAELVGPLRDGHIDLMVGALRPAETDYICGEPLFQDLPLIVGRSGHPLAAPRGGHRAADLLSYPWIMPAPGTPLRALWSRMFETLGAEPPDVSLECGSVMMIRQLLMGGDHLTLLSEDQVAVELEAGWLRSFGPAPGDLGRTIGVSVRSDWRPTAHQKQFLDLLRTASVTSAAFIS